MKLHIMSLVAAAALFVSSCGTTRTSTTSNAAYDLPTAIRSDFEAQYPTAINVTWANYDAATTPIDWELTDWSAMDANDYVVRFDMGTDKYYAWYEADGAWIGSAYAVSNTTLLPAAVHTTLNTQFSGYTLETVQKEMWKDRMAYELKLKNGDSKVKLLVDANGNILKQKDKD